MKRILLTLATVVVALASPAGAQQLGSGWDQPQTPATRAVAAAVLKGLCAKPALDAIAATGLPTQFVNAGGSSQAGTVVWYAKGGGCDGKFQFVSADQGYAQGWEIRWDPNSWVVGPGDPFYNGMHPTAWQLNPFAAWQGPLPTPAPIPMPPPAPIPTPAPTPPPVTPAPVVIDVAAILAKMDEIEKKADANAARLEAAINEPGWFKTFFSNRYVQMALGAAAGWIGTKAAQ